MRYANLSFLYIFLIYIIILFILRIFIIFFNDFSIKAFSVEIVKVIKIFINLFNSFFIKVFRVIKSDFFDDFLFLMIFLFKSYIINAIL